MKILVLGGNGWLGAGISRALAREGHEVVVAARGVVDGPRARAVDLLERPSLERLLAVERPDGVVHAAGRTAGQGDPAALYRIHVEGTVNLIEALAALAPRTHLVALGSAAEYGLGAEGQRFREDEPCRPAGHYGLSKLLQTEVELHSARERGLEVTVLRTFNPVGAGVRPGLLLGDLFERLRALAARGGGRLETGGLDAVRDFVPLERLEAAVAAVIAGRGPMGVLNVATGVGTRVRELVGWLVEASSFPVALAERAVDSARSGGGWSVGDPAALDRVLGARALPDARQAVLAAYETDVLAGAALHKEES